MRRNIFTLDGCALALAVVLAGSPAADAHAMRIIPDAPRPVTGATLGAAVDAQFDPAAASNGQGWLGVWSDLSTYALDLSMSQVFGAPFSDEGVPLAPRRHLLRGIDPAIAANGTRYLVAAGARCDDFGECSTGIEAALVDGEGVRLRHLRLETQEAAEHAIVSVAANDGVYAITWIARTPGGAGRLYVALVDAAGALAMPPRPLTDAIVDAAVAPAQSGFRIVQIAANGTASAIALSADGSSAEPRPLLTSVAPPLSLAYAGDEHALSYFRDGVAHVAFLSAGGAVMRSTPLPFEGEVALLAAGRQFLCVGESPAGTIRGRLVGSDGTSVPAGSLDVVRHADFAPSPALVARGSTILLLWTSGRAGVPDFSRDAADVRATPIALTETWPPSEGNVVAIAAGRQDPAQISCGGGSCLAFWYDALGLRVARHEPGMATPPAEGRAVPGGPGQYLLDVAFNGESHLAVWLESLQPRVVAMRFDADGRPLDDEPQPLPLPKDDLQIASDGSGFLVAARDLDGRHRIVAVRIARSGETLDAVPFELLPGRAAQRGFALSWNGAHYAVASIEAIGEDASRVVVALLDREGALASPVRPVHPAAALIGEVALGASAGRHLVTWTVREDLLRYDRRLYGAFAGADGAPAAPFALTDDAAFVSGPRVVGLSGGFALLWHRTAAGDTIRAAARFLRYGASPEGETSDALPRLLFDVAPLEGDRFAVLTRTHHPELGEVGRAAVAVHRAAGIRRRAVR